LETLRGENLEDMVGKARRKSEGPLTVVECKKLKSGVLFSQTLNISLLAFFVFRNISIAVEIWYRATCYGAGAL
jgi:hypothetical protein